MPANRAPPCAGVSLVRARFAELSVSRQRRARCKFTRNISARCFGARPGENPAPAPFAIATRRAPRSPGLGPPVENQHHARAVRLAEGPSTPPAPPAPAPKRVEPVVGEEIRLGEPGERLQVDRAHRVDEPDQPPPPRSPPPWARAIAAGSVASAAETPAASILLRDQRRAAPSSRAARWTPGYPFAASARAVAAPTPPLPAPNQNPSAHRSPAPRCIFPSRCARYGGGGGGKGRSAGDAPVARGVGGGRIMRFAYAGIDFLADAFRRPGGRRLGAGEALHPPL